MVVSSRGVWGRDYLYGGDNWIMSAESTKMLELFQGGVATCILQLPKWYSNAAAVVALGLSSLHAICACSYHQETTFPTPRDGE